MGSSMSELTETEHLAMATSAELAELVHQVIGDGPNAAQDWAEMAHYIHVIQRTVLSQAAGRAYPDLYRLLGETLR